jgi:hypothetical protein
MKYKLNYKCKVLLNNENYFKTNGEIDSETKIHYSEAYKEIVRRIDKYLLNKEKKHYEIKDIEISLKYSEQKSFSNEEIFFYNLLDETAKAFETTETKKKYPNENWNFAICDTPIQIGKGLFFGLNWGGSNINRQTEYPKKDKKREWRFIKNVRPYIKEYFNKEIENLNYSNLCFFRTPKANQIVKQDWDKAIYLFSKYTHFVKPKWTLMLGNPPKQLKSSNYLSNLELIKIIDSSKENVKVVKGYTGMLFGKYPFGCVPHPQARISIQARKEIWDKIIEKLNI